MTRTIFKTYAEHRSRPFRPSVVREEDGGWTWVGSLVPNLLNTQLHVWFERPWYLHLGKISFADRALLDFDQKLKTLGAFIPAARPTVKDVHDVWMSTPQLGGQFFNQAPRQVILIVLFFELFAAALSVWADLMLAEIRVYVERTTKYWARAGKKNGLSPLQVRDKKGQPREGIVLPLLERTAPMAYGWRTRAKEASPIVPMIRRVKNEYRSLKFWRSVDAGSYQLTLPDKVAIEHFWKLIHDTHAPLTAQKQPVTAAA